MMLNKRFMKANCSVILPLLLFFCMPLRPQTVAPTTEQVVQRMEQMNAERAARLKAYSGERVYELHYRGFPGSRDAEMTVQVHYTAPATKEFKVEKEAGSKLLLSKVLERLLASEKEALENSTQSALTSQNYSFALLREEQGKDESFYVLSAEPKHKNKFLIRGTIWVDSHDYSVVRIDAEPAKNPSFWISKTHIEHRYAKVGEFWLPAENQSVTTVRVGGTATLTIRYMNYVITDSDKTASASLPQSPAH